MKIVRFSLLLVVMLLLTACMKRGITMIAEPGKNYYTRYTIQYQNGRYRTNNYRLGKILPFNSAVRFIKNDTNNIYVRILPSGEPLKIERVQKTGNDSLKATFEQLFTAKKVNLSIYFPRVLDSIESGSIEDGMSREMVILTLGYPPRSKTPSLNANRWVYWSSPSRPFTVHFKKGQVYDVTDGAL